MPTLHLSMRCGKNVLFSSMEFKLRYNLVYNNFFDLTAVAMNTI
jgi:hypothetical protein